MLKYAKKVIILSPAKNSFSPSRPDDLRGIFTIERTAGGVKGVLVLYNFVADANAKYVLAVTDSSGNKYKIEITPSAGERYLFDFNSDINLEGKITAVFVKIENGKIEPLIWGAADSGISPQKDFKELLTEFETEIGEAQENFSRLGHAKPELKKEQNKNENAFADKNFEDKITELKDDEEYETDREINDIIDDTLAKYPKDDILFKDEKENEKVIFDKGKECEKCLYRNNFYSGRGGVKTNSYDLGGAAVLEDEKKGGDEPQRNDEPKEKGKAKDFFNIVSVQIDSLFEKYPRETVLEQLLPQSKWVKVDYQGNGDYYAIGLLYNEDVLKYIAYAVPKDIHGEPPTELKGFSQWFPINVAEPDGKGYWIMYQDSLTGECVVVNGKK